MMEGEALIYWLVKYLNCIFEIFLLYIFLEEIFPVYEDRKSVLVLESGICITVIFLINRAGVPHINLIGVSLVYVLFVWLIFRIQLRIIIPYVWFYYIIFAVTEFVFQHVYEALDIGITMEGFSWMLRLLIEKLVVFIIIQVIRKIHQYSPKAEVYPVLAGLFILPVSVLILLNGFLLSDSSVYGYFFVCIGGIMLIFSNVVNFWAVEKMLSVETIAKDNEMLALKTELERNHYRRLEEINQEYAKYLHEMRHIARTIDHFAELEGREELRKLSSEASSLLKRENISQKKIYCADPILNAVFIDREKSAQDVGVGYEVDIQPGISLGFLNETDKIRIFGNLLDNALEAARECKDSGYVKASLYMGNNAMIVFRLINNFAHKNTKTGKIFQTTKRNGKAHGFGLQNVEELARKYNGVFGVTEENDQFVVMLVLSNMQKM